MSLKFNIHPEYDKDAFIFAAVEAAAGFADMTEVNDYFRSRCQK